MIGQTDQQFLVSRTPMWSVAYTGFHVLCLTPSAAILVGASVIQPCFLTRLLLSDGRCMKRRHKHRRTGIWLGNHCRSLEGEKEVVSKVTST